MIEVIKTAKYDIQLSASFVILEQVLAQFKNSKLFVLVDENTSKHCLPLVSSFFKNDFHTIEIDAGEENKNLKTCETIWEQLKIGGAKRSDLLLNLGGGVIGDMGGFCASTYKRGINFIQMPTTLLSMVDASIGGKLGINFSGLKNNVGLFNNPNAVLIFPEFLKTLPHNQIKSGFAEMLKHSLIANKNHWENLKNIYPKVDTIIINDIKNSILIKKEIVEQDFKESGLRKLLNYGHTVGHALESWSLKNEENSLLHGEAIAIGMIIENYFASKTLEFSIEEMEQVNKVILNVFDKRNIENYNIYELLVLMKQDKKNLDNQISFSLLQNIGEAKFDKHIETQLIKEGINYYKNLKQ